MRGSPFLLAICGAIAGVGNLVAQNCDSCGSISSRTHCSCCDDRGLLDGVDQIAGRIHSGVNRMTRGLRREMGVGLGSLRRCKTCNSCASSCDGPSWHSGSCPSCGSGVSSDSVSHNEFDDVSAIPQPTAESPPAHHGLQHQNSPLPMQPPPRQLSPTPAAPMPQTAPAQSPYSVPTDPPTRDSKVNPFADEPHASNMRSNVRRVPGRTIQYQRSSRPVHRQAPARSSQQPYGQRFDLQAANSASNIQMNDESMDYWAGTEFAQSQTEIRIVTASSVVPVQSPNNRMTDRNQPRQLAPRTTQRNSQQNPLRPQ